MKGSFSANGTAGQPAAAKLCAADFHGCELEVVRNRCPSRVGIKGIVIKDTKMTFAIITKEDQVKHVPKEHSVFRFEIPWPEDTSNSANPIVLELHGSNFMFRAADRMNKKFKAKSMEDL
ncbi:hypothetical protein ABW19_dt0201874 [Dactylella cylindrospora]|nr:hypothetical protein ABW19_dt0201874 [Dactylella cylindrospora]